MTPKIYREATEGIGGSVVQPEDKNLKIDFIEGIIDVEGDNYVNGFIGSIKELKITCSGTTKEKVLEECLTSIKVLLAYNSGIALSQPQQPIEQLAEHNYDVKEWIKNSVDEQPIEQEEQEEFNQDLIDALKESIKKEEEDKLQKAIDFCNERVAIKSQMIKIDDDRQRELIRAERDGSLVELYKVKSFLESLKQ